MLTKEAPFLLTVFFSVLAWTANQLSIELGKTPTIEITSKGYVESEKEIRYTITNISTSTVFSDLKLTIKVDKHTKCIGKPIVELLPPTMESRDTDEPKCEKGLDGDLAVYSVSQFHPHSVLQLTMNVDVESKSSLYVKSTRAVRVINSSVESFLIKNKVKFLFYFFLTWLTLIVIYLIVIPICLFVIPIIKIY